MNTITRVLSRISCFASCHPGIVLALALAGIVAVIGLMAFGVFALFVPPAVPKLLLLAAITLAAFLAIRQMR
jgi:uncharacterized membrane protein YccC